jgi:hypothetical protein
MANALYDAARQKFLDADIDYSVDTIKVMLVDTGAYTVNLATHDALDDVPAGARIGTAQTLGTKTSTAGVADAADATFPSVTGASVEALVVYKDSGTESTSWLIAYIDTATGLPVTPNGGNITVAWDNGANKIFKL